MIPFQLHRRIPLIRRPFWQRDQALAEVAQLRRDLDCERDRAHAEAARLMQERDDLVAESEHREAASAAQIQALHAQIQHLQDEISRTATVEFTMPPGAAIPSLRMLKCNDRDQVVSAVRLSGWTAFEPPMPELLYRLAQQLDGALLDIGANTGFYSLVGAAARCDMEILAFEPDPKVLPILRDNLKINGVHGRVRVFPMALSDSRGQAKLYIPTQEHGLIESSSSLESQFKGTHSEVIDVPMDTVDDVIVAERLRMVAMIKVDVEGHEAAVLRGARTTVGTYRPVLFVEALPNANFASLNQFIREHGYKDIRLRPNGAADARDEVFFDRDAWNHVFVPPEKMGLVTPC